MARASVGIERKRGHTVRTSQSLDRRSPIHKQLTRCVASFWGHSKSKALQFIPTLLLQTQNKPRVRAILPGLGGGYGPGANFRWWGAQPRKGGQSHTVGLRVLADASGCRAVGVGKGTRGGKGGPRVPLEHPLGVFDLHTGATLGT